MEDTERDTLSSVVCPHRCGRVREEHHREADEVSDTNASSVWFKQKNASIHPGQRCVVTACPVGPRWTPCIVLTLESSGRTNVFSLYMRRGHNIFIIFYNSVISVMFMWML